MCVIPGITGIGASDTCRPRTNQTKGESIKGEVQLSGFVDSAQNVRRAGEVARGVQGVKSVKNDLIVK
jgi:osmotically-inducible protein OsmY